VNPSERDPRPDTTVSRRILRQALRAALPLMLIGLFFLAFLVVLNSTFPSGTGLADLFRLGAGSTTAEFGSDPTFPAAVRGAAQPDMEPMVAHVLSMQRAVRHRAPDSVAWTGAETGMPLENRAAIQTLSDSSAVLDFDGDGRLILGENTLAVVRRLEKSSARREKHASVLVLSGEIRGSIAPVSGEAVRLEVTTGSAQGRILGAAAETGGRTVFHVTENPDRTSTFSVFEGDAEISAAGRSVHVGPGFTVTVQPARPPGDPVLLPAPPEPLAPAEDDLRPYRSAPPRLEFRWTPVAHATVYRIQLAHDAEFVRLIHEARVETPSFVHGNLPEGDYWWRVATVRDWAESAPSPPRRVRVLRDIEPPELRVEFPSEPVAAGRLVLRGIAEPGARIFVAGQEARAGVSGEFEVVVDLREGVHAIVVQAMDSAGNVTHRSAELAAAL
jgi:mannose-6-phosphate isomerase-like protein (cupin superfamily)